MGSAQSTDLNTDTNAKLTSSEFGDRGDAQNRWYQWKRVANGGDTTQGAIADVAVTDPAASGSVVALLKGVLTAMRLSAAGMLKAEDAVAASGDSGVMALAVRRDTAATDASAAGDYTPLHVDALGRLRVTGTQLEDAAHATGDAGQMALGVRNDARTALTSADGDYSPLATGPAGSVFTNPVPEGSVGWALSRAATVAAANSLIVKASAGKLYKLHIQNGATAQFFQVSNTTTVPADATVPIHVFRLAASEFLEIDFTAFGNHFATGITVCNSTTLATKTIGAADSWITAQFL